MEKKNSQDLRGFDGSHLAIFSQHDPAILSFGSDPVEKFFFTGDLKGFDGSHLTIFSSQRDPAIFPPMHIYIYIYLYYILYTYDIYIYYFSYPYPILPILPTSFIKRVSAVTLGSVWSFSGYVSGTKSASMDFRKDVRHFFGAILWFVRPSVPCCFAAGRCFSCSSVGMLLNALFKLFFVI